MATLYPINNDSVINNGSVINNDDDYVVHVGHRCAWKIVNLYEMKFYMSFNFLREARFQTYLFSFSMVESLP